VRLAPVQEAVKPHNAARGLIRKAHASGHAIDDVREVLVIGFDLALLTARDEHMRGNLGREG
jgi:hypothetical protein